MQFKSRYSGKYFIYHGHYEVSIVETANFPQDYSLKTLIRQEWQKLCFLPHRVYAHVSDAHA